MDAASLASFDEHWMMRALAEAERAAARGEVPIGAVLVRGEQLLASDHNRREEREDPTAHAEILVLRSAAAALGTWRLLDCWLYVTLEPCPMCAGAIVQAQLGRLIFGAANPKAGACGSLYRLTEDARLNHQVATVGGVLADSCAAVLSRFFQQQRAAGKK